MKAGLVLLISTLLGCSPRVPLPTDSLADTLRGLAKGGGDAPLRVLKRETDCSLTLLLVDSSTRAVISSVPDYHLQLRAEAGLPPTPDDFPDGCVDSNLGTQGQPGLSLGRLVDGRYFGLATPVGSNGSVFAYVTDGTEANPDATAIALATATAENSFTAGIASGDFDGDGRGDAVVSVLGVAATPGSHSQLALLSSDANGALSLTDTYPSTENAGNVTAIDLDDDGDLDLVQGHNIAVEIRLNNGDGTFTAPTNLPGVSGDVIAGDVDGDTIADIVTSTGRVRTGNGNATFASLPDIANVGAQVFKFALGDVDGDGDNDLVALTLTDLEDFGQQFVRIHLNDGNGGFSVLDTGYVAVPSMPHVSLTHLDGDANLDIVLGAAGAGLYGPDQNGPGELQVLLGLGGGQFAGVPAFGGTARTLADWTADGVPDLLELGLGSIRLLQGGADGNFLSTASTAVNFPTFPELPQEYLAIDLDNDGRNDLLAIHKDAFDPDTSTRWTRLIANDDGTFVSDPGATEAVALALQFPVRAAQFVVLDADGDAFPDVVGAGLSQLADGATPAVSTLFLRRGTGTGSLGAVETLDTALGAVRAVVAGDLDGDDDTDLIVLDGGTTTETTEPVAGAVHVFLGDGTGDFARTQTLLAGTWPTAVALGDVDADGDADLVATYDDADGIRALQAFLNTDATFSPSPQRALSGGERIPVALALADFDGDRRSDVIVGSCCGFNAYSLQFAGLGDGTFADPVYRPLLDSPQRLTVATVNGDTTPDLVQFRNARAAVFFGIPPVTIFDDGFE